MSYKKIILILSFILLLSSCSIFSGFKTEQPSEVLKHEHVFSILDYNENNHFYRCEYPDCMEISNETPHTFGDEEIIKEATHTTPGKKIQKCLECDYALNLTISVTDHTLIHHERVEPTCGKSGLEEYYECSECEKLFKTSEAKEEDLIDNLSTLSLKRTPHNKAGECVYEELDKWGLKGRITCYCECGKPVGSVNLPSFTQSDFDKNVYEWKVLPEKCGYARFKSIHVKEEYVRESISDFIELYVNDEVGEGLLDSIINKIKENGIFDKKLSEAYYGIQNHTYNIEVIEQPTLDTPGKIRLSCAVCDKVMINDEGSEITNIYYDSFYINNGSLLPKCESDGYAKYKYDPYYLRTYIQRLYSNDRLVSDSSNSDYNFDDIEFDELIKIFPKLNHDYVLNYTPPTLSSTGLVCISCNNCNGYLTNTSNNEVIIPNITNEEYFNYSTTATCVLDGLETFKYNLDSIKSLINKELGLTIEDINKYIIPSLNDINIEVEAYGHKYDNHVIKVIALPTYDTDGLVAFPCDVCNAYREIDEDVFEYIIPKYSDTNEYIHENMTATCNSSGEAKVKLKFSWYRNIKPNWKDLDEYFVDETITDEINSSIIQIPKVSHIYSSSFNEETYEVAFKCSYSDCTLGENIITIPKTKVVFDSTHYAGNCMNKSYDDYYINSTKFKAYLEENTNLTSDYFLTYDFKNLCNMIKFRQDGKINYNNHIGDIKYDPLYGISFPKYNSTSGECRLKCSECKDSIEHTFSFESGYWTFYDTYATRSYNIYGSTLVDTKKYSEFEYRIDVGSGSPNNSNYQLVQTVPIDFDSIITCDLDDFRASDGGYPSGFEVYIDGIHYERHDMINYRTSLGVLFLDILYYKGMGNVLIKVLY